MLFRKEVCCPGCPIFLNNSNISLRICDILIECQLSVALTFIRRRPPMVSQFEPYAHIFRTVDILIKCHHLIIFFAKTVQH